MLEFLFQAEYYPTLRTYCILFIHSPATLYLDGFQLPAIESNVAMDLGVRIPAGVLAFDSLGEYSQRWKCWIVTFSMLKAGGELLYGH